MRNIVQTGRVGLLFLIPGMAETLRVNGRAAISRDPVLLEQHVTQGKRPKTVIGVDLDEAFLHCAKAFIRSTLWRPEIWPARDSLARPAQIWKDHIGSPTHSKRSKPGSPTTTRTTPPRPARASCVHARGLTPERANLAPVAHTGSAHTGA